MLNPNMVAPPSQQNIRGPKDFYADYQTAQSKFNELAAYDPSQYVDPWMPETRSLSPGNTEYLVGDKWYNQQAWDDPSFQSAMVDPYRQQMQNKGAGQAAQSHAQALAAAQKNAEMAKFEWENYQKRMEEIKAQQSAPQQTNPVGSVSSRMIGTGRGY